MPGMTTRSRLTALAAPLLLAGLLGVMSAGCSGGGDRATSAPLSAAERSAQGKALAALDDQWSKAAASRDTARIASFYSEDAVIYPPGSPPVTGRAAAQEVWGLLVADPAFSLSWSATHAEVAACGDLGFTSGPYQATLTGPGGAKILERGKFLCVWRRQSDGTWKAAHDMWNADAP